MEFIECDTCRAKSGMPVLCETCLHNRRLIEDFKTEIKSLKAKVAAAEDGDHLNKIKAEVIDHLRGRESHRLIET